MVVGGRAPANRWGSGSLQELDQPPILAPVTKLARTIHTAGRGRRRACTRRSPLAGSSHRGPVFLDVPMDEFFNTVDRRPSGGRPQRRRVEPDGDAIADIAELLGQASRPVLVLGTDVWADGAEEAALRLVEEAGLPVITNGMGRGVVPGGHPLLVTKARSVAFGGADLVVVVGTPLDFRLGYGVFGGKDGATPARVVHLADSPGQVSPHAELAGRGVRRPDPGARRPPRRGRRPGPPARLVGLGHRAAGHRQRGRRARRRAARGRRPTRSTRPASTASWCPGWPTTRS